MQNFTLCAPILPWYHCDDGHEGSSVRKYRQPVKDPLEDVSDVNQRGAFKLGPKVPEEKDGRGCDAAGQDVDNDQERKPGSRIVEEETEGVGKGDSEHTKEDDDESEGAPAVMKKEGLLGIQTEDEGEHNEGGAEVQGQVPDQVGQPEHTLQ